MSAFKFTEKERYRIQLGSDLQLPIELFDRIETILSEREQDGWVRVEDVRRMLQQGIAYGMGVVSGMHNLHPSEAFIRSTCKKYTDELLSSPPNPNK